VNISIDRQSLLGLLSATGLPPLFHAIISFLHPALYTLACGQAYVDGAAACYADDKWEAVLWLVLSALAVAYGGVTFWARASKNPTPPPGTRNAVIPEGQVPVTVDRDGATGLQTAKANLGTVQQLQPIVPIEEK
jgi:hypothetical protein